MGGFTTKHCKWLYVHNNLSLFHFGSAITSINTGLHKLNEMEDQEVMSIFKSLRSLLVSEQTPHFGGAIEPINTGFHKLNEMEDQEAVSIFKLILQFTMKESHSKDKELLLGNYIVQKVSLSDCLNSK